LEQKKNKDGKDESPVTSLYYLRALADTIRESATRPDVKQWNVDQIDVLILTTIGRRREAQVGVERARAALVEAIGLERDCLAAVDAPGLLPNLKPAIDKDAIIALALDRRGEIRQALAGLETTTLEIKAQKKSFGLRGDTFASGSDLHADPVPQGIANGEYRPGAITVEMPAQLVGKRGARIEQAEALQGRAAAVADKARHLITLEAEDAYFKWAEASQQAEEYRKAADKAVKVADFLSDQEKGFKPGDAQGRKPTFEDLTDARVKAVQLQLLANQAHFNALLALAALERITAGGFNPGFDQLGR
jgi:outer membrane protein TolC